MSTESASLEALIAQLLVAHEGPQFIDGPGDMRCQCGHNCDNGPNTEDLYATKNWAEHVTAELVKALGTVEFVTTQPVPERWWSTKIQEQDEQGNWQWPKIVNIILIVGNATLWRRP